MTHPFYVTTPIYYVNDVPHIGHAYTTIAADVLARFQRLIGHDAFFLTGLDEHGQKVQQAAAKAGIAPQTHCDRLTPQFQDLWQYLHISNDAFIRTTDAQHQAIVQRYLNRLFEKDLIYRAEYTGWYCTFDERFWTEKDVEGGLCPDCRRPVEKLSESNYFFRMSQFQNQLLTHIQSHEAFIRPASRRNEVLGFLQKPLEDLSISRPKSRLSWGIELPFDSNYVTYVWFDALVNYISGPEYLPSSPSLDRYWPASLHLVGKDILTTHAVYWSTMLMALELPLPQSIFAHGWWTVSGEKMSKSRGNVVDPYAMVKEFGADAFRYFLLREVPFGQDGDFSKDALIKRYNSYLANGIGNLHSRTLTLIERNFNQLVPQPSESANRELENEIKATAENLLQKVKDSLFDDHHLPNPEFNVALSIVWNFITLVDRYIDQTEPWSLAKAPEGTERLKTVLYTSSEALRFLSVILSPFMPEISREMRRQLGLAIDGNEPPDQKSNLFQWGGLSPGAKIAKGKPLFPRIDAPKTEKEKRPVNQDPSTTPKTSAIPSSSQPPTKDGGQLSTPPPPTDPLISIEDFQKIQLKVAKVITAERVPKSSKLLKLQVDLGSEQRQIVAGIGKKYEPDELVGQTIVVVANLKPAKLMGVESQGMVLAAGEGEVKGLLTVTEEVELGSKIK